MDSNNSATGSSDSMADGIGNRRAVSNGNVSGASLLTNQESSPAQPTPNPGLLLLRFPEHHAYGFELLLGNNLTNPDFQLVQQNKLFHSMDGERRLYQTEGPVRQFHPMDGGVRLQQFSNMRSISGPSMPYTNNGNFPQGLVRHASTGNRERYGQNQARFTNDISRHQNSYRHPQSSAYPYPNTQESRIYVSPYSRNQNPNNSSREDSLSANVESYSATRDRFNADTSSTMSFGSVKQPSKKSQNSRSFSLPMMHSQQTSNSFTNLHPTNSTGTGFDSPAQQVRSVGRPAGSSPTVARALTNEEQAQAELDAFQSSDDDNSQTNVPRPRTIQYDQVNKHDFISEYPQGSGKFYVFKCYQCTPARRFKHAILAGTHFSVFHTYTGAATGRANIGVDSCGVLVTHIPAGTVATEHNWARNELKSAKKFWRDGRDNEGFDLEGYDQDGFDRAGFNKAGLDKNGNPRPADN